MDIMMKCFAAEPGRQAKDRNRQVWRTCAKEDLDAALELFATEVGTGFSKENFASGWMLRELHRRNYPVFVMFRAPQHTFPFIPTGWYSRDMLTNLLATEREALEELPHGHGLVFFQEALRKNVTHAQNPVNECVGHYLHFWHLLAVARDEEVPVVTLESLVLLEDGDLSKYLVPLCDKLQLTPPRCQDLAAAILRGRQLPTHLHSTTKQLAAAEGHTRNFSMHLLLEKEATYRRKAVGCDEAVSTLARLCEKHVEGCREVNDLYFSAFSISLTSK